MKKRAYLSGIIVFLLYVLTGAIVHAEGTPAGDRTLSPYFFVSGGDPSVDRMPLKSTSASVNIIGVIADVAVSQVYRNEGNKALEAVYVFPASTRAAVYGMRMTIGKRVIEAEIKKKEDARREYEEARSQGRSASLLEQQRPNVFRMNVANILPGDTVKVELKYTELIVPTDRTYEFVYPTVVGPRYSNQPAATSPESANWVENPHLHQGQAPNYAFSVNVNIRAGLPIRGISCRSHKVKVGYDGPASASVSLDRSETSAGNRDFILRYRLTGDRIESGLLLSEGEKEKFFLLMLQPPKRVSPAQMPGREYIFIVDVSGSMYGFPLDISKRLFRDLVTNLRPSDRFNILLFSGGSAVLSENSLAATPENIRKAASFIDQQQGGGGTELLPALKRALSLPKSEGYSRTVVIATDGYVTVEEEAFDLIRRNLGNANMFAFGIGTSVNRHLIEGMARAGMGEPFVITSAEEAPARAAAFRQTIESPVLSHINVSYTGFDAYDIEPVAVPDLLADRPVIVFGKWRGAAKGKISVQGITGGGRFRETVDIEKFRPSVKNSGLRYLWARHRIALLSDYNSLRPDEKRIREVTLLGLQYNLLTAYTSFVAVDSEVRNRTGEHTTVRQPLPMPEGVSDYAVGRNAAPVAPATQRPMLKAAGEMLSGLVQQALPEAAKKESKSNDAAAQAPVVDEISATGGITEEIVRKIINKHYHELQSCLSKTGLRGRVSVEVSLDADGDIKSLRITSQTLKDDKGIRCIRGKIRKWRFGMERTAAPAVIKFTLIF